ncbi:recombinase family protein [Anaerovibrio lipolyticus]|uniref:recombinase family protein n=1 Tax=Anaerovibrio lipolyticus TaxID=82374 RepID=UPI0004835A34|nr:recombinase family protein [Anaerovibrio lipolyticus]
MTGQKVGYARVSTVEQNEARQVETLKSHGCEKIFIDKLSGKDMHRPQLEEMLRYVREGDTVIVSEYSRLARSTKDLLDIVQGLSDHGITVISDKEKLDTSTPQGKLMLTVFAALAEFEREIMLQRQREGIAIAKAQGKYKGRTPIKKPGDWPDLYSRYMNRGYSIGGLAKVCGCSKATVWRWIQEEKKNS